MLTKIKDSSLLTKILWFVLILEFCLVFYMNITQSAVNMDEDAAKVFVHAIEMSKNGTLFVPGWKYMTTLELDCSLLLAVPLYTVTKNIYLSFAMSNIIFLALLVYSVYRIFRNSNEMHSFLLAAVFICIPYAFSMLDYTNMLFFNASQYIIKVTLPIMLISVISYGFKLKNNTFSCKVENAVFTAVFMALLFISSLSSGVYVLACGIFPVIAGSFIWRVHNHKPIGKDFFIISVLTATASVAGFAMNIFMGINAKGNSMVLCMQKDMFDNIVLCFTSLLQVFGASTYKTVEVMSYDGINILMRIFFVLCMVICAFVAFSKTIKKEMDEKYSLLVAVFVWNLFVLCVCDTRYNPAWFEYRYHLIGVIPLICIASKLIYDAVSGLDKKMFGCGIAVVLCLVAGLNFTSYRTISGISMRGVYAQICSYAQQADCENVYIYRDTATSEICRLIDGEREYLTIDKEGLTEVHGYYLSLHQIKPDFENSLLVVSEDMGQEMELFDSTFVRTVQIEDKSIYVLK